MLTIMLTFGLILTGCNNQDDGSNEPTEVTYTYSDTDGNIYKLVVTKSPDRAFQPQSGDTYVLTITSPNGNVVTSTGTVTGVSNNESGITFSLQNTYGTFTVGVSGDRISEIPGQIILDNNERRDPPDTLNPNNPSPPPTPNSPTVTSVTVSAVGDETLVNGGYTRQFRATVIGTNNPSQTVTWSIDETPGKHADTTINNEGLLFVSGYESPAGVPLTIRATSTVDRTKSGTIQVMARGKPSATGITIESSDIPVVGGTATMSRSSSGTFTANVSIVGAPKTGANQEVDWTYNVGSEDNIPRFINADGTLGAPLMQGNAPNQTTYSLGTATVNGLTLNTITLNIAYDETPGTRIRIRATYNGDMDQSPAAPPRLIGELIVTVGNTPPGMQLVNNFHRTGTFAASQPGAIHYYWFQKSPVVANDNHIIRIFDTNNAVPGLDNTIALSNLTVVLRFYDANGNRNAGKPDIDITSMLIMDGVYAISKSDFGNDEFASIIVTNNTNNGGQYAITWNSDLPSATP